MTAPTKAQNSIYHTYYNNASHLQYALLQRIHSTICGRHVHILLHLKCHYMYTQVHVVQQCKKRLKYVLMPLHSAT